MCAVMERQSVHFVYHGFVVYCSFVSMMQACNHNWGDFIYIHEVQLCYWPPHQCGCGSNGQIKWWYVDVLISTEPILNLSSAHWAYVCILIIYWPNRKLKKRIEHFISQFLVATIFWKWCYNTPQLVQIIWFYF